MPENSGIARRFPESDNLTHLQNNLFNKRDLITGDDRRWKLGNPDIPQRTGKVNNIEKFDARFFGIKSNAAEMMDPMARMLLEHTYEAIVDAGVNPQKLRETNTGVFIGTCHSESEKTEMYEGKLNGFGLMGCSRAMMANRISQWLGCTGPSYSIDTACSSSLFAMDHAYRAIRNGECDAALVEGCNLCLHPCVSWQFFLLGVLSSGGSCKSFDADGNGYCRSEAVSVIYLQKSKDARRIYAHVIHTKTNSDGFKQEITFPSGTMQEALLQQFYTECKVTPSDMAFIEAHGTGTKVGDPVEVDAIEKVFCPGRKTPLRIGSVKSNLGHSEPASGLCSIAKVVIAMESGYISPNIHYNRPREEIKALIDGRIQVITELTPWEGAGKQSVDSESSQLIQEILDDLPLLRADIHVVAPSEKFNIDTLPSSIKLFNLNKLTAESDTLLAITQRLSTNKDAETLLQLQKAIVNGGFLLAREPLNEHVDMYSIISSDIFDIILEKRVRNESVILFRKKEKIPEMSAVISINNNDFAWLSTLQEALKQKNSAQRRNTGRILVVSENNFESGLMGLVNCLRKEPGGDSIQGLLIQDSQAPTFSLKNPFYSNQLKLGLTLNVLRPQKEWGSYRFSAMDPMTLRPVYHARISQLVRSDLSTLKWVNSEIHPSFQSRDLIKIHYFSINFRDVMVSTGKLAAEVIGKTRQLQDNVLGFEFSGKDISGRAVMGMLRSAAFANVCICDRELLWPVPDDWTLEDAATVPVVYGTAYYALYSSGEMKKGDRVLIHAGSGGVGQAAITLALHEGCAVFTTVRTPRKREFIKNRFPQIGDDYIVNSRDTSFEQLILRKTRGRGVDIVLNSLAEEKLQASVRCLAAGGRFLEIGKFDLAANNNLGMEHFLKGIRFHGILLDNVSSASPERKKKLTAMLTEGLKNGAVKPLVRTVFPMDEVEEAFRYMAAGKHIGKVVIKIRDEKESCPSPQPFALPRYYCSDDGSYLILGGLGGFGLELADWLVLRGAKKLVLTSRKGISNGYQRMRINIWRNYGVEVVVVIGKDASIRGDCEAILNEARALGPVEAIFNLAVVLKDALFKDQTVDSFEESLRVKAWATKQLDVLSRSLCPHLKQFVVFSSVSCGRGNAGQTNYGMANSIMERICEARAMEDLPGLAIQWGAIGDVGLVAEMQEDHKEVVIGGTLQQSIVSCLEELDGFLQQKSPVVSSMVVAEKKTGAGTCDMVAAVGNLMGLKDVKTVSPHTPLSELGMDSMTAVEIKQMLELEFEVFLTSSDIRSLNFAKLQQIALERENKTETPESENDTDFAGMKILFSTLGTDSFNTDICVSLKTSTKSGGEVFLLPGIEGTDTVFQSLASKLKSSTFCLQLGIHYSNRNSIGDMADYFLSHVTKRNENRQEFTIVGYSFGSLVAIELVRRLESEGRRPKTEQLYAACSSFYTRILAVHNYDCSTFPPLQTPIILIKPRIKSVQAMSEDYGLRLLTREKVEIHYAEGNHATMLEDDICAVLIDGELTKDEKHNSENL